MSWGRLAHWITLSSMVFIGCRGAAKALPFYVESARMTHILDSPLAIAWTGSQVIIWDIAKQGPIIDLHAKKLALPYNARELPLERGNLPLVIDSQIRLLATTEGLVYQIPPPQRPRTNPVGGYAPIQWKARDTHPQRFFYFYSPKDNHADQMVLIGKDGVVLSTPLHLNTRYNVALVRQFASNHSFAEIIARFQMQPISVAVYHQGQPKLRSHNIPHRTRGWNEQYEDPVVQIIETEQAHLYLLLYSSGRVALTNEENGEERTVINPVLGRGTIAIERRHPQQRPGRFVAIDAQGQRTVYNLAQKIKALTRQCQLFTSATVQTEATSLL